MADSGLASSLRGLKVLDCSRVLAGPYATQILGDLGADVLKVERPGNGDETRSWGPPFTESGLSAYFLSANRNKRSVALDLDQKSDLETFFKLRTKADVIVENFLPASAQRLGLDWASVHVNNPRAILCSITGYGHSSALADRPGYDFVLQAESGLMRATGEIDGAPQKVGVAVVDVLTGLNAVIGILAALEYRHQYASGLHVDIALADVAFASQVNLAQAFLVTGKQPKRQGNAHLQIVPYGVFAAEDGDLVLAVGNDGQWQRFCALSGDMALGSDPRWQTNPQRVGGRDELLPRIAGLMRGRRVAEWLAACAAAGVPAGRVGSYADFAEMQAKASRPVTITARDGHGNAVNLIASPLVRDQEVRHFPPRIGEGGDAAVREWLA